MEPRNFERYLEAKYALDSRSINPTVSRRFRELLQSAGPLRQRAARPLRVCDLGTGTGAMVRRVLQSVGGPLEVTALDLNAESLVQAGDYTLQAMRAEGFRSGGDSAPAGGRGLSAHDQAGPAGPPGGGAAGADRAHTKTTGSEQLVLHDYQDLAHTVRFRELDLGSAAGRTRLAAERFDLITGHAIMDLLPLKPSAEAMAQALEPGGLLYATLTYNGATTVLPGYHDRGFEEAVFELYDASMDARGGAYGGRRAGARLFDAVAAAGFALEGFGASDWQIVPGAHGYLGGDAVVAEALIAMIHRELSGSRSLKQRDLDRWREKRLAQIEASELTIVVHHTDLLARKP